MKKIILIGAGGHARSCIDVIEQSKKYKIFGLIDNKKSKSKIFGYSIVGTDKELKKISRKVSNAIVCIGQIKTAKTRIKLYEKALKYNFKLPVIISPYSYVSPHAKIDEGSIIMHGAVVNAGVVIGRNCIINSNSNIEHDVNIGDHCHVAPGAVLNGSVKLESGGFVGSGSIIREKIKIGINSVVGANTFLNKDLKSNKIFK